MPQPIMSNSAGISFMREATPGTQPVTGARKIQVDQGGITGFQRDNVVVARHVQSPNLTMERGEVVGYDSSPKLKLDVTKDFWDLFRELVFRSTTFQAGGTGAAQFFPTAVTAGSPATWTVAAGGALPAGTLVRYKNATNPANEGLHPLAAGSTALSVKTADVLVTEVPGATSVLEVAGFQATIAADIQLDANGNLISTSIDFTTLGLVAGQNIGVGDATSGAAFAFATARNGYATIKAIAAHLITLKWRSWTLAGADAAAGKTIRLLWHTENHNVAMDPTGANSYLVEPTGSFELSKPGSGGGTDYVYFNGDAVSELKLTMPLEGKITADLSFIGMKVSDATNAQAAGFGAALDPIGAGAHTTAGKLVDLRLMKQSDETVLSLDVQTWSLDYKNNCKALKAQGTAGAIGHIFGEYTPMISLTGYVTDSLINVALNAYTDLVLVALFKSSDGSGFALTFPMCKPVKGTDTYAANDGETIALELEADRDPATGRAWTLSQYAYLP